ncbi:MAG: NRDE family protein [Cytophagales bacterium]|nr:NRDE family protein [Cytophagales bacterium]
MCLCFVAWKVHPDYSLILLSNRDELYNRPTETAQWLREHPQILCGRDRAKKGTWLGVTQSAAFATLTNYRKREIDDSSEEKKSRGTLVMDFLRAPQTSPNSYLKSLSLHNYSGFNLLIGNSQELWYANNMVPERKKLRPGIYGLSNSRIDDPWFKVLRGKEVFSQHIQASRLAISSLFKMMKDPNLAPSDQLPKTGFPKSWEKICSARFVQSPQYGTRTTSLLCIPYKGKSQFKELSHYPKPKEVSYEF